MRKVPRPVTQLYAGLVHLYPRSFRAEFGEEMRSVFADAAAKAAERGGMSLAAVCLRELRGLPRVLLSEYGALFKSKTGRGMAMGAVSENGRKTADRSASLAQEASSWKATLAGLLPFLLFGLGWVIYVADELLSAGEAYGRTYYVVEDGFYVLLAAFAVLVAGVGVAWVKGFPRWSFPYLGVVVTYSWFCTDLTINAFPIIGDPYQRERDLLGWRAWIPLLAAIVIALLITRSLRPLRKLAEDIWRDWTLLSFALYGAVLPLFAAASTDSIEQPIHLLGVLGHALGLGIGALGYLRCRTAWQRVLALEAGMLLVLIGGFSAPGLWEGNSWMPPLLSVRGLSILAFWSGPVLLPGVVGLLRRGVQALRAAGT